MLTRWQGLSSQEENEEETSKLESRPQLSICCQCEEQLYIVEQTH